MKYLKQIWDSERKFIIAVFFLALAIRLIYAVFLAPETLSPDAYDYMNIAGGILSGHGYGESWRPPGWPFFLSAVFLASGKSVLAAKLANCLLGAFTCVFIYFIGKKIFSAITGKFASLFLIYYPYFAAYAGDLLSENLLTFLLSASILSILNTAKHNSIKNIAISGVLIGLTGLVKATVMPFFLIACAWLWWRTGSFKTAFLAGALSLLTISPWTLRNYLYYGEFLLISPGYGSLWVANNDEAMLLETMGEQNSPMSPEISWTPERFGEYMKLPRMDAERIFKKEAFEWIKNNPEKFFWLVKKRFLHFWRLYPMMAYKWQKYAAMATSGIYIPLCIAGIILSIKKFRETSLFLALFAVYTAIHLSFVVTLRYRVPIDPYLIIFASYTISRLLKNYLPDQEAIPANGQNP